MNPITLSRDATLLSADGRSARYGLTVLDHGDTVSLDGTEHAKQDLRLEGHRIVSVHGWEVAL